MGNTCPMSCLLNKNKIIPITNNKITNNKINNYKKKYKSKKINKKFKSKSIKSNKIIPISNIDKYRIN